jgi:DNA-binding response OmpR family regulator
MSVPILDGPDAAVGIPRNPTERIFAELQVIRRRLDPVLRDVDRLRAGRLPEWERVHQAALIASRSVQAAIEAVPDRPFAEVSPVPRDCDIDGLKISIDSRTAWYGGRKIRLSQMEFGLLVALAREPSRVYTKAELLRDVWDYRGRGAPRTVDTHACRLRRKLIAAGAPTGRFVRCLWGVGYSLSCPD